MAAAPSELKEVTEGANDTPAEASTSSVNNEAPPVNTSENDSDLKTPLESEGGVDGEEEDEVEGECGFCLFMKGGGCRESFIAWENCVEEAGKSKEDVVEKCFELTSLLKKCMEDNSEYYEPILRAEKIADEEASKELERGKSSHESDRRDQQSTSTDELSD